MVMLRGAAGAGFAGGSWAWARKGVRNRAATIQKRNRIKHLREGMELTAGRAIPARRRRKRQDFKTENTSSVLSVSVPGREAAARLRPCKATITFSWWVWVRAMTVARDARARGRL